jgi:pseudouridine-5'-phosphate glycosidase
MKNKLKNFRVSLEVIQAQQMGLPLVALESTVITHGLPWPHNLALAEDMEHVVRTEGAVPATIAVLDGQVRIGLTPAELHTLAEAKTSRKISLRDYGIATARGLSGGTTVAATLHAAHMAGIQVFATGGIGGVHRNAPFDISADLPQLGRTPLVVVCAGAKSILDLPATLETLETQGVPVVGYQTDAFPAFYATDSGLKVDIRAASPAEVAAIARAHWGLGLQSAVLVVVPPPAEAAIPSNTMETVIQQALADAASAGVKGNAVTPYLLARVAELTGGESMQANLALLLNNGRVAAAIARHLTGKPTAISTI